MTRTVSFTDISTVSAAPARAITSHRFGCAEPNSANTVVKITGSGFQLEPPAMCSAWSTDGPVPVTAWKISRPQISHDQGS